MKNRTTNAALKAIDSVLAEAPDHPHFRLLKASILTALGRFAESDAITASFAEENWDNPEILNTLARQAGQSRIE